MTSLRPALAMLLLACSLPQCSMPAFVAKRTDNIDLSATGVTGLDCTSHNGSIVVSGAPNQPTIRIRAELSVRGHSQQEADDNLRLMEISHELKDGVLHLSGKYPQGSLNSVSPSFAFRLEVPAGCNATLTTHNGNIEIGGLDGRQKLLTHNGSITTRSTADRIDCESHNGKITLSLDRDGNVDGDIKTHNGGIELTLGKSVNTTLAASTHNGSITTPDTAKYLERKRDRVRCEIGNGQGNLAVETHNGGIRVQ
jgi:hypothetical protein